VLAFAPTCQAITFRENKSIITHKYANPEAVLMTKLPKPLDKSQNLCYTIKHNH